MATNDNEPFMRADPDALLNVITKKTSKRKGGRLYLYIGMAPGVGKTYAMLMAARDAQKNGVDVVVGVAESHGREETEKLLKGLEIIPKTQAFHRGISFYEMDIDAILRRKPQVVVVDELAHSNVPGSRHAKRWQDVFELLDASIDVYSTLNVQHLESRKDSVEEIAKITVSETVPDSVLDRAFQIQLVDLSVPNLLRRLKEGKVYLGEQAELAASNFFKEDKLTALREIALRVAAERVDAELQTFAIERPAGTFWPAAERLLVGVGLGSDTNEVIRTSRRLAYNLDAPWIALHVSSGESISEQQQINLTKNLDLARSLGAEVIIVNDTDVASALIRIARQKDISQIIVGRPRKRLKNYFGIPSIHDQLIKKSSIHICVLGPRQKSKSFNIRSLGAFKIKSTFASYTKALLITGVMVSISFAILPIIGYRAVGFLFLLGILGLGLFVPIGTVLFAAIITTVAWNFFFIPPVGNFHLHKPDDLFLCIAYFVAALATGLLTRKNKYQQNIMLTRELRSQSVKRILLDITKDASAKEICASFTKEIENLLKGESDVVLLKKDGTPYLIGEMNLSNINREMAVAKWSIDNNKLAGSTTETLSSAEALYIPLKGAFNVMGAIAFKPKKNPSVEDIDFLFTLARPLALALEMQKLRKRALETEKLYESERTHQLIVEYLAAEVIAYLNGKESREQLLFNIDNLLLLSRLSRGIFPLKKNEQTLRSLLDAAIARVQSLTGQKILFKDEVFANTRLSVEGDILVQSLANILLNSAQHGGGTEISVTLRPYEIIISDQGPGLRKEEIGRVFEKFYRSPTAQSSGYGIGLYIAKSVIKAHNAKITLKTRANGGLSTTINFHTNNAPAESGA